MTRRFQALWLPAVATILVADASLSLMTLAGTRPWTIPLDWRFFHSHHPLQFHVPWLIALPVVGAAGATWSLQRGGYLREAAKVALAPAVAVIGLAAVATPIDLLVDVVIRRGHTLEHTFCGTAWLLVSFAIAPGLALALGFVAAAVWWHHAARAGVKAIQPEASRA